MTEMTALRAEAAVARAAAASQRQVASIPDGKPLREDVRFGSELRAKKVDRDGQQYYFVEGYASVFERGYEMWDMFGPYTEVVSAGAADKTLDAKPFVVYRFNHAGTPMANTQNGRLELFADETGLGDRAWLNPKRDDVDLLIKAIDDQDITEQSFMFQITSGHWSPDYTEYRIDEFDLDRGDVGPVTYGANPHTSVAARSGDWLAMLPNVSPLARREAFQLLSSQPELAGRGEPKTPAPPAASLTMGRSLALVEAELLADVDN